MSLESERNLEKGGRRRILDPGAIADHLGVEAVQLEDYVEETWNLGRVRRDKVPRWFVGLSDPINYITTSLTLYPKLNRIDVSKFEGFDEGTIAGHTELRGYHIRVKQVLFVENGIRFIEAAGGRNITLETWVNRQGQILFVSTPTNQYFQLNRPKPKHSWNFE